MSSSNISDHPIGYQAEPCPNCGRWRLEWDGADLSCEKCRWSVTQQRYILPHEDWTAQEFDWSILERAKGVRVEQQR